MLHAACQVAGLPSASLWAPVPHYVAATPNPKASLALVRKLEGLVGVVRHCRRRRGARIFRVADRSGAGADSALFLRREHPAARR